MKTSCFFLWLLCFCCCVQAQDTTFSKPHADTVPTDSSIARALQSRMCCGCVSAVANKKRTYIIASVHATAYAGTLFILGQAWYKNYPRSSFQLFNDSKEWMQVDKIGHGWTAYNIAQYSTSMWQWAGMPRRKAVVLGGLSSLGYQTIIEYLDAHSAQWGWSWADMGANVFGAAMFTTEELAWKEQRILFKFSSFPVRHSRELQPRAQQLFGNSIPERILKDYNGQHYWLSANIKAFAPHARVPRWLNIAVGYGARGMYGGFENKAVDKNGNVVFDRTDIKRMRRWYLSPDVDWTKIKTNKKGVRTLFTLMNMIKVPAPSLQYSGGKFKGSWVTF